MCLVILSSRKCFGLRVGGTPEIIFFFLKGKDKKSIVVCINHAAATENYENMS